jgi:hypothetical protein
VQNFAALAKPLTELTKEDRPFTWGPEQKNAFNGLKDKLCKAPLLTYSNFSLPFILTIDISKTAVAAILSQTQDGMERTIAYASRQMKKVEQNFSASEAEILAPVWATKQYRRYLYDKNFWSELNRRPLHNCETSPKNNCKLIRRSLRLSDFDFAIAHRAATKIRCDDALIRHVVMVLEEG